VTKKIKNELQNIISGKSEVRFGAIIQSITHHLKESTLTSQEVKGTKSFKRQETESLKKFIKQTSLSNNTSSM
jgi:hypothetical protein